MGWLFKVICPWLKNILNYFKTKTKFVLLKNQHILPILILGDWPRLESVMGKNLCWPWLPHCSIMKTSVLLGLCKAIMEVVNNPVLKSFTDFEYFFSFP